MTKRAPAGPQRVLWAASATMTSPRPAEGNCGTCQSNVHTMHDGDSMADGLYTLPCGTCNDKLVYVARLRPAKDYNDEWTMQEKDRPTYLFQPTGTQH